MWMGTLVLAGAAFGLAVATAQTKVSRIRGALLTWALIPLTVLTYFYLSITGSSMPPLGARMAFFITARDGGGKRHSRRPLHLGRNGTLGAPVRTETLTPAPGGV
jgi:hypothetical protein